ncbi:MAG: acyl-CoA desaturase [Bacteroidota bacterium]
MSLKGKVKFVSNDKTRFFQVLKQRVDGYFEENNISKHANSTMVIKSIVLLSAYILPFVAITVFNPNPWLSMSLWLLMGIALAGIGMSVMHDGNHGAYSSSKTVNSMMGQTLALLGGSAFNWKLQHNILHHTYTNVVPMDEDIQDRLVMRFSPHTEVKGFHRFQWIYAFFFYGLLSLYWVVAKDLVQFVSFKKSGVNPNNEKENRVLLAKIILLKTVYLSVFFGVPMIIGGLSFLQVLPGFLLMHFIAGLILTVVFQLAHTVEDTHHPLANESGTIENDWAIHQLNTTANFSPDNKFIGWYVGGLNYQIEHHLFPKICHVHYPGISKIVKQTAEEYGIEYLENKSFGCALRSHVNTLKRFGTTPEHAFDF